MLVPFAFGALVLTKIPAAPVGILFKKMQEQENAEQHVDLIGRRWKCYANLRSVSGHSRTWAESGSDC